MISDILVFVVFSGVACSSCDIVAARCGVLRGLSCCLSYYCAKWIMSSIVNTLLGKNELILFFSCALRKHTYIILTPLYPTFI